MTPTHRIARLRDGSINFEYYHSQAANLRAQAIKDTLNSKVIFKCAAFSVAMMAAFAIVIAASA